MSSRRRAFSAPASPRSADWPVKHGICWATARIHPPSGDQLPAEYKGSQDHWLAELRACNQCHQLGMTATRIGGHVVAELPHGADHEAVMQLITGVHAA